MSYTVIARRWRPQKLDEVVGQRAVTQTLRNAITSGRIAQAFVFAGPRGVGKTTTARILARMLNCDNGPTPDPCGACDACREIAESRDMDVLEIDAATHTGIDNVREVIISGLAIMPVRDRYKIFIIDEVHQLSGPSFNALLKSIEEPPPHVTFIMATTVPDKIPDTIVSRSQVFEFKTIASGKIAEQLKKIADDPEDPITVSPEAIALVARAAEGSMRDAETAFDQVIAFAGKTITVEDVATVLGLVGRDLLFDVMTAVADENGAAAFELAGRAVEAGYDLKLLCRELARLVRDLLVLSVDPSRITDPDIAPESDRDRIEALRLRFSREDLLRSFDVLTRAESEIRSAAEPRYHLEMALLRWIHLRKLTPLADLIERLENGAPLAPSGGARAAMTASPAPFAAPRPAPSSSVSVARKLSTTTGRATPSPTPSTPVPARTDAPSATSGRSPGATPAAAPDPDPPPAAPPAGTGGGVKDAFIAGIQKSRSMLYSTIVAQAQRIDIEGDRIVFRFGPIQTMLADQVAQQKAWLETLALEVVGRKMTVTADVARGEAGVKPMAAGTRPDPAVNRAADLRAAALRDPVVQSLLEIFPAEVKDVTELKDS
jgi:DNA polymerase-3 subunit gamma/tau